MRHGARLRPLICAGLAVSALVLTALPAPGAAAASTVPLTVTCGGLLGSQTSEAFSYCYGTGAVAADAGSAPTRGVLMTAPRTIHWTATGKTAQVSFTLVAHSGTADTCVALKGFTKYLLENETGRVLAAGTTATGMIGGAIKATLCVYKKPGTTTLLLLNQGRFTI